MTLSPYFLHFLVLLSMLLLYRKSDLQLLGHYQVCRTATRLVGKDEILACNFQSHTGSMMDLDSSVGIATRYGLDGPGIEPRWRRDFTPVQTGPEGNQTSYAMVFHGGKEAGEWR